jgi:hypothetical protein
MVHNDEAVGSRGGAHGWSWPRTINKWPAYELTRYDFMVPPDTRLPGGWNISADDYPVLPLPCRKEVAYLIKSCRRALSEDDRADLSYGLRSDLWMMMLANERKACIEAFG